MTINKALDYIYSFINLEKKIKQKYLDKEYSLNNIYKLIKYFDNPQHNLKIIHIAGTKGKGSTALFLSKFLIDSGYSTTIFASPHLVRVNERFLYNNKEISDQTLIDITINIKQVLEKNFLTPTTFEFFFIIFLLFSKQKKPDYTIIEVGLGGRLDCTNIVNPILSVITPIGIDHTEYLGNTIEKIAKEKAGIIKQNKPIVCGFQKENAFNILKEISRQKNAKFYSIKEYFSYYNIKSEANGILFDFTFNGKKYHNYFISLMGYHQIENFATALFSLFVINKDLVNTILSKHKIFLSNKGRIQVLRESPLLVVDVAHNEDSAEKLASALHLHFKNKKWTVVCGLAEGKDYDAFFSKLSSVIKKLYISPLSKYKMSNPKLVFKHAKKYFKDVVLFESLQNALDFIVNSKEILLVTGSFYLIGPLVELLEKV